MGCAALLIREVGTVPYASDEQRTRDCRSAGHPGPDEASFWAGAVAARTADGSTNGDPVDAERIETLGDEIATLSAHVHAATQRLLVLIAEFDRLRGWEVAGYGNSARWLSARTGIDLGAAREKMRAARALTQLPLTSAAMARGELSFSQVRALSRVARPETEAELLELARGASTAQLERIVRALRSRKR